MPHKKNSSRVSPDAMTDPETEDGGGHDAASALAFQIVENASIDEDIARRLRQAFDGDTETCASLKLRVSITAVRRACRNGRPSVRLLRRICILYDVEGTWVLTGEGPMRRETKPADGVPSEDLLREVSQRLSTMIATLESSRESGVQNLHTGKPNGAHKQAGTDRHWL
jgi:hypothetical protein